MIVIKQGQTFTATGSYRENDQITPKSLAGVILTSKIRDRKDVIIADLTVTVTNSAAGLYTITYPPGTLTWPCETLYWDIFETVGGVVSATQTETIVVERGQSR